MHFDYIIVGAGTSGCVLANRLTEDPGVRVLLLEAGSRDLHPMIHVPGGVGMLFGQRVNWRFHTVPQPFLDNRRIWYPQGKTLGGSSSINAMIYIRGQKEDYDGWVAEGNKGWAYDDVLPYFRKSEDNSRLVDAYHGQGGPQAVSDQTNPHPLSTAFVRAAQSWGLPYNPDFNGASMAGAGLYQVISRAGTRRSQAASFLRPALHRKNLTLKTGARVVKIAHYIKEERLPGISAQTDDGIMAYARQYASCDYHPAGTCRMGTGEDAVVGPDLCLRGLEALRVIDASIMPRLVSGDTMAPTMMIAEKGADLVKGA